MAPTRSRRRKSTPARRVVKTRRRRMLNSDKPELWDENIELSVLQYNRWFTHFAPKAFRETRAGTAEMVKRTIEASRDLGGLTADVILKHPSILETLRMCCCPPIARDRLIGLARVPDSVVDTLEEGKLPTRMNAQLLKTNVNKIVTILKAMLDEDLFPWLEPERTATDAERTRASTVIADRLCFARTNPIVRNAQEERQITEIKQYLRPKGYVEERPASLKLMRPGTFCFRYNVQVTTEGGPVNIPIDAIISPLTPRPGKLPIMIECKSAGDFANVNKRRKEEGQKGRQLRTEFGDQLTYLLFICGYFGKTYLQYEAGEQFDWVWEHRIADFDPLVT